MSAGGSVGRPAVLVGLAIVGALISIVLALFQLGLIGDVWDPIFGAGSRAVLTSAVSRALPVPDAVIGTAGYLVDAALGVALLLRLGRPSMVATLLAIVASVGGVVGIALAVAQPLIAGAGCTLCLCSTAVSVALGVGALTEARDRRAADDREPRHVESRALVRGEENR